MSPRPLRGERYAEKAAKPLLQAIQELPYLDHEEANRLLKELVACKLTPDETALLGCNDRYFLMTVLLNRHDINHPWLYARCREVEASPDGHIDLWAREHRKSSIITFAGCIQEVLINPEITIGIFANNKGISRPFLRLIKHELETNDRLKYLYQDVLWGDPAKEAPIWSLDHGIVVRREGNQKEATIEAHGIDALPTGRHFDLMVFDDVITERNVTNEEQIAHATVQFELADSLGRAEQSRKQIVGTRYLFGDTYSVMLDRHVAKARIYPATDDGTKDGNPVLLSPDAWAKKKKAQTTTLSAQYLQNPIAGDEQTFRTSWLRPYWLRPTVINVYILCDPSMGRSAESDRTAIAVIGIDAQGNKFLLDGFCHRMKLSERWMHLRMLYRKWVSAPGVQFVSVGYERYGMQSDLEYFEERMRIDGPSFEIKEVSWTREGDQSKKARVQRLEPDFRNGAFYIPAKVWYPQAATEIDDEDEPVAERATHGGTCVWHTEKGKDDIFFRRLGGLVKADVEARIRGEVYRIMEPLRRIDENRNVYDVTREFFEEYKYFPFGARKDFVDAMSRVYDLEPVPAAPAETFVPEVYSD